MPTKVFSLGELFSFINLHIYARIKLSRLIITSPFNAMLATFRWKNILLFMIKGYFPIKSKSPVAKYIRMLKNQTDESTLLNLYVHISFKYIRNLFWLWRYSVRRIWNTQTITPYSITWFMYARGEKNLIQFKRYTRTFARRVSRIAWQNRIKFMPKKIRIQFPFERMNLYFIISFFRANIRHRHNTDNTENSVII